MPFDLKISDICDYVLLASCFFILIGSILISFKMRFVQLRLFPLLIKNFFNSFKDHSRHEQSNTILPYKALLTAMSTTVGIGTIVAPVIAIRLGGPGALLGFVLTALFGSAATFTEVNLCMTHRQRLPDGTILGGPMQYIKKLLSPGAAKWYALGCTLLMMTWSGAQANQIAAILNSPFLGDYRVPTFISGGIIICGVLMTLAGGIRRVGSLSVKLVPLMFTLYVGSCLFIIGSNYDKLSGIMNDVFYSAFSPYAMATGTLIGGLVGSMRWGIFKGIQATEAGVGTQTIPHSMAETDDPVAQGTLAMLSTYTAGFVSVLSGIVALITESWQDPDLPIGISMVVASFKEYFSFAGIIMVAISTFLFAFGTIVGNSYNGSYCFSYLSKGKGIWYYFIASAIIIFLGAISEVTLVWSLSDLVLASIVLPHMAALLIHVFKKPVEVLSAA
jgi:AGCS family alanine or glycine:cation symporter